MIPLAIGVSTNNVVALKRFRVWMVVQLIPMVICRNYYFLG